KDELGNSLNASFYSNRFLYTGREWIQEIGLYDYRNRVYSPELGRFLQTDPIRFDAGDVNLYRYVGNNSIMYTDPSGLTPAHAWGAVAIGFAAIISEILEEFGEWIVNQAHTKNCKENCLRLCTTGGGIASAGLLAGYTIASVGCTPYFTPYPPIGFACIGAVNTKMNLATSNTKSMMDSCRNYCNTLPSTEPPECCEE
ncbi:MAG: RHS repeat-associated core domain-containing protein, partial [Blastochloris sp.]|nr:RHS repeat-associated core domain-containing protein [Blastochloris sp.]